MNFPQCPAIFTGNSIRQLADQAPSTKQIQNSKFQIQKLNRPSTIDHRPSTIDHRQSYLISPVRDLL
jgi:hypothetical protein